MTETWLLFLVFPGGLLLGIFFYGGLWWTVRKGLSSRRPALWFFTSYLLRMGVTVAGLSALADGHWQRLLVFFLGWLTARLLVMQLDKWAAPNNPARGIGHAA